ncbi:MAG: DUF433 domain-containing protein [Armatimonadetes bacterium]|nr:DUF433 domain-containing protein [Armatimonadota bacterium]
MELADLGKIAIYEERLNAEPPSEFRIGISPESDNGNKSQKESNGTEEFSHWTKRIFCIPGVCGGKPCIAGTRIPVWVLEHFRRSGASDAEILKAYPSLTAGDLVAAWQYAHIHEKEINTQIKQNRGE